MSLLPQMGRYIRFRVCHLAPYRRFGAAPAPMPCPRPTPPHRACPSLPRPLGRRTPGSPSEQQGLLVDGPTSTAGADADDAAGGGLPPRPAAPASAAALRTTRVFAAGICCPMEVPLVHSVLGGMPGVHSVEVSGARRLRRAALRRPA